jgi:monofunctional glycosyltransferase
MAYHWLKGKIGAEDDYRPRYEWRPLGKISRHLAKAVLAGEDQRFLSHHGFDFVELNDAVQEMAAGERSRGASTISMQTARSVFLWQGRSWLRKSLEAYYTVLIELVWGKRRILEIYLNTVDWGTNVVGAEAASMKYFQRTAASLTPEEGALLAAILPSPHNWSPVNPTDYVRERQKRILKDMKHLRVP